MKLYCVRHGESEANVLKIISNRGSVHGLTETGHQQARALAEQLKDIVFEQVFCSPLLRARQTVEYFKLPYTVTDALREFDCGIAEGKTDEESWQRLHRVWQAWMVERQLDARIEEGECFRDVQARFSPLIESLVSQYGQQAVNVLLVGHGGTFRAMLPVLVNNLDFDFAYRHGLANTEYALVEYQNPAFVCLQWGKEKFV